MDNISSTTPHLQERDPLWLNIRELPYFRGLLRAVEAREYQNIALPGPVLDLGCGDGQFVTTAFDHPIDVGIDPWKEPVREAARRKSYQLTVHGSGDQIPFADRFFGSAMSNSVLEHIPELDPVLEEVARVLKPEGIFVFCVPNHRFLDNLSISRFFQHIGLKKLAEWYRKFFNRISRHHHCDNAQVWEERLKKAGFTIEKQWDYFSPGATKVLEWGHYFGFPSLITHFLFRKWIIVPARWNLWFTNKLVNKHYMEPRNQPEGSYSFYITRKTQ
jgi:SAM-dependent methyltransferase